MQLDDNFLNLKQQPSSSFSDLFKSQIDNELSNVSNKAFQSLNTEVSYAKDIDQYRFQKDFNPQTFNPFDPKNEERWINNETWSSAMRKGFDGFKTRFGNTFVDYWKDYGRMGDAFIHWDMRKMMPSEYEMLQQHYQDKQESLRNKVFVPAGDEDSLFSKSSISEFVSNSGFALGTTAAFTLELAADAVLTALTAGAGSGKLLATIGKGIGKKVVKEAVEKGAKETVEKVVKKNILTDLVEGASFGSVDQIIRAGSKADPLASYGVAQIGKKKFKSSINEVMEVATFNMKNIVKSKSFGEFALNVAKGVPIMGTGVRSAEKIVVAGKSGFNIATQVGIGINGLRRMGTEYNMSSTESSFEAIGTYGETLDTMLKNFADSNGRAPSALEYKDIQLRASTAAFRNYQTNLSILLASNKIQFGTLFNKMGFHKTWIKNVMSEGAEDLINVTTKEGSKIYSKSGIGGGIRTVSKIAKDAGKRKAVWEGLKMFRKDFMKFEAVEGLQEILQESSNIAWSNYYGEQYNDASKTIVDAFGEGLGEQWSPQGLKVFVHGAMTGGMIRIPTQLLNAGTTEIQKRLYDTQYGKENNPARQAEKQRKEDIETVNNLTNDFKKSKASTLVAQLQTSLQMDQAVKENSEYEWNNARDTQIIKGVLAAGRLGMTDAYAYAIEHAADEMTVEEFNEAFQIDITQTKYENPQDFAKSVSEDVRNYAKNLERITDTFRDKLVDPSIYAEGSSKNYIAKILRNKQEEAINLIALNGLKADRNMERVNKMKDEISTIPGLESSSLYAFNILINPTNLVKELGNLNGQLEIINDSLDSDLTTKEEKEQLKKDKDNIDKQIKDLQTWLGYWSKEHGFVGKHIKTEQSETSDEVTYDTQHEEVLNTFRNIINNKNKEEGISDISEKAFQDSSSKLVDIIRLGQETESLLEGYYSLHNPEAYSKVVQRMTEGQIKHLILNSLVGAKANLENNAMIALMQSKIDISEYKTYIANLENIFRADPTFKSLLEKVTNPAKTMEDLGSFEEELSVFKSKLDSLYDIWYSTFNVADDRKDISNEELESKNISDDSISQIARAKVKGLDLLENENKAYNIDSVKDKVDKLVEKLNVFATPTFKTDKEAETADEEFTPETVDEEVISEQNNKEKEEVLETISVKPDITVSNDKFVADIINNERNTLFGLEVDNLEFEVLLRQWLNTKYNSKDWNTVFKDGRSKKALQRQISLIKETLSNVQQDIVEEVTPIMPVDKEDLNLDSTVDDKTDTTPSSYTEASQSFGEWVKNYAKEKVVSSEKNVNFAKNKEKELVDLLKNIKC
ncbi:MAG: hypothetical protein EOL97_04645 [Spirochaetia bacterium]|nr:hypothetical protein [Spirochaetia bacterium]